MVDIFTLRDVAVAAERVYENCMRDRGLIGLEYLGGGCGRRF